ncbi:MAG: hypothetical protein IJ167_03725 [Lachnospiraceae bacterium]|nr:hypothetical protein [Lachnospiraceae bacterium]
MAGLIEYNCPACGGKIQFDSVTQQMKCPYCDSVFDMEALKERDEVLNQPQSEMEWGNKAGQDWVPGETDGIRVYSCNSCGGEIIVDENVGATKCPYCDSPVVMTGQFQGALKPDYVIPFKLDKNAAKAALNKHLQGKKLLPKVFKDQNHIDEIKGIYVPFWLFDADVDADMSFNATKEKHWSDSSFNYTKTEHYLLKRRADLSFRRVPVDGSTQMEDSLMESIEPFDFNEAVTFQSAYLSGFLADKYDVTAEQSIARANQRIKQSAEDVMRESVNGYSSVTTASNNVRIKEGVTKYALYPVWLLNTTWNGEHYYFAMNGQTGKFVGDLPCDKSAYKKGLFAWTAILGAIFTCISLFVLF